MLTFLEYADAEQREAAIVESDGPLDAPAWLKMGHGPRSEYRVTEAVVLDEMTAIQREPYFARARKMGGLAFDGAE